MGNMNTRQDRARLGLLVQEAAKRVAEQKLVTGGNNTNVTDADKAEIMGNVATSVFVGEARSVTSNINPGSGLLGRVRTLFKSNEYEADLSARYKDAYKKSNEMK